jgi:uncharacterized protein YegP (UPF0339 family)
MNRLRLATASVFALTFAIISVPNADGGGKANKLRFEIYKDKASEFRWRLLDADGAAMAGSGQGYTTKQSCKDGVESVKTHGASDKAKFEIYEDKGKEFRWRLLATNGNNIASSSGSFKSKADAEATIATLKKALPKASVEEAK